MTRGKNDMHTMTKRTGALFVASLLALAGCSGENGAAGQAGAAGTSCTVTDNGDGTATISCTDGTTATVENGTDGQNGANGANGSNGQSCTLVTNPDNTRTLTCGDGSTTTLPAPVALAGKVEVVNPVAAVDGADVVVTATVKLDGFANSAFTNKSSGYRYAGATSATAVRTSLAADAYSVAVANGAYTFRIPGVAATVGTTPTTFMLRVNAGVGAPAATVVAHLNAKPKSTVSDQACMNCHGTNVFWREGEHHGANPQGAGACVVCHTRASSSETRLGTAETVVNGVVTPGTAQGTRFMGYVHGIHNSHNMADGVYSRNGSTSATSQFSIGFPGYMNNCSTCHDTQENLDLVLSKAVSFPTCMSCHDGWNGFSAANTGTAEAPIYAFNGVNHAPFSAVTSCAPCHNGPRGGAGTIAPATVGDFHGKNQMYTARNGLLYDGKDQSVEYGKRLLTKIDSVSYDTAATPNLVVTWSATLDGAAVDPCNADIAAGPVFLGLTANAATGQSASNMNLLQAYAQGNDWVNRAGTGSPGQPLATNLTTTNTVCASNVATSTIAVQPGVTATKGVVSLQGKPQITFTSGSYTRVIQVRSPSPIREFVVGTGAEPAAGEKRRAIVSTAKCLQCHKGSLYQHGGNRVDSVDLCVTCHNPASSDTFRQSIGVDATESYDGKGNVSYDLRYMLHAIHSAGSTGAPYVIYRSNGIYAFGSEAAIAKLKAEKNWPGAGTNLPVYGSDDNLDGTPRTADLRNHNEIVVHYPRPLNDCAACHVDDAGSVQLPSTSRAVGVTVDPGPLTAPATWGNQLDDTFQSPAMASCMSCHQSGDVGMQSALQAHAMQNSWTPAIFNGGRQDVLSGRASEACLLCHGDGRVSDFNAKHAQPVLGSGGGGH
jgi:OmcA/MtrC family decaheme c-type cytochrome